MADNQCCAARQTNRSVWQYHIMALVTSIIWSTTFVSTKTLLNHGLTPENIFLYRFLLAYVGILAFTPKKLFADSLKDEFLLFLAGLTGGSLYFITENTALQYTYASNVSILISVTPLFTMTISALVFKHKLRKSMFFGSIIALAGVTLVVLNGNATFKTSPIGDILVLAAAICWASYCVIMKYLGSHRYSTLFLTRKVFFYGVASMALYFPFSGCNLDIRLLADPVVCSNILFLGVVASLICFAVFNRVVEVIGPDKASNYIYLSPLGTITTAVIFLNEPVTLMAVIGAIITIIGVIIVEKVK